MYKKELLTKDSGSAFIINQSINYLLQSIQFTSCVSKKRSFYYNTIVIIFSSAADKLFIKQLPGAYTVVATAVVGFPLK